MITIRVNALPTTDHHQSSNSNVVTAVTHGNLTLTLYRDWRQAEWWFHNSNVHGPAEKGERPGERLEDVDDQRLAEDVDQRLTAVLTSAAADPAGLLHITLEGQRRFTVPRHHWPVLQVAVERQP